MCCNRYRGTGGIRVQWLDGEAGAVDGGEHGTGAGIGGALATAFDDFRGVPGWSGRHSRHEWYGRGYRGVGGSAGQDDIGALLQGCDYWFVAHHADYSGAAFQGLGGQVC
jgi:hypothetical protein